MILRKETRETFVIFAVVLGIMLAGVMMNKASKTLEHWAFPRKYQDIIEEKSDEYGVPESVIYAVIRQESNYDTFAQSRVGARGLMQIMKTTAEWIDYYRGTETKWDDLYDPETNIDMGVWLLKYLYGLYGSWETVYAAYNAGFGAVSGWLEDPGYSKDGRTLDVIPYDETANYVKRVIKYRKGYIAAYDIK